MAPKVSKFVLTLSWLAWIVTAMPPASSADVVTVGDIQFNKRNGNEKVCFVLKPFCNPRVFSLEGNKPRIVMDIVNVHSWKGRSKMPVEGVFVRQVRTHFHSDQKRLRIVLDLTPSRDYTAEPLYYKAEGIYCISVSTK
jgi:hypothetical protein